jgi:GxxExxY protein
VEQVHENALAQALRDAGLGMGQQRSVKVHCNGIVAGEYSTDLLAEDVVLVEPKAAKELNDVTRMQCTNYLKAAGLPPCLLLNFGKPHLEIKRVVRDL